MAENDSVLTSSGRLQGMIHGISDAMLILDNKPNQNGYTFKEYQRIRNEYEECLQAVLFSGQEEVYAEAYIDAFDAACLSKRTLDEIYKEKD